MKKIKNPYSLRRKLYDVLTVMSLILMVLSFLISRFVKDGVFEVKNTSVTFGLISYVCMTLTAIFLFFEIKFSDKEEKLNK